MVAITAGELVLALVSADRIDKIPSALFPFTLSYGYSGNDEQGERVFVDQSEEYDYVEAVNSGITWLAVHWDDPAVMSTIYDIEAR